MPLSFSVTHPPSQVPPPVQFNHALQRPDSACWFPFTPPKRRVAQLGHPLRCLPYDRFTRSISTVSETPSGSSSVPVRFVRGLLSALICCVPPECARPRAQQLPSD